MEKVIIIGAGPAGISAALYAVRGNLDPLVINNGIGALEKAEKIENYYGLEHPLSGQELYDTGIAQRLRRHRKKPSVHDREWIQTGQCRNPLAHCSGFGHQTKSIGRCHRR